MNKTATPSLMTLTALSALTILSVTVGAPALAAPAADSCTALHARIHEDSRIGWLAQRPAHPRSAEASEALRGVPCATAPASSGYVDRRAQRREAVRNDLRVGWLAMHRAHPLSAAAEASVTE